MRRRYPREWLPRDSRTESAWSPDQISHAQTGRHQPLFFDRPATLEAWVTASQQWQAEAVRLQTEAFRRMDRLVSCAVHLFIDAWPAGWMKSIMDCERRPKAGWFACRDALTPWLPMWRSDRLAVFAGEALTSEAWLANDTTDEPRGWTLRYTLEMADRVLASGKVVAKSRICAPVFQGQLRWTAPKVEQRTEVVLRLGLFDQSGRIINDSASRIVVWPKLRVSQLKINIWAKGGPAERLARELAASNDSDAKVILADHVPADARRRQELWQRVRAGAKLIFTELPPGRHRIANHTLVVSPCGFTPYDFISRATDHPLVAGFEANDFRFWHEPRSDMISPLLPATFQAPGWNSILLTGEAGWEKAARPALAAAEIQHGQGRIIVSLVSLAGRTITNPVAKLFAKRLIDTDIETKYSVEAGA